MTRFSFRYLLPVMAGISLLFACSSAKNASGISRQAIKGTWVLDNISYDGLAAGEKLKLTLLEEGTEDCLKGSTWVLPNNGNGSYTISAAEGGCQPGEKNIVWSYRTEASQPIFQFKKLTGGEKAMDIADGYRFKVLSANETSLSLQSEVNYQGNPIYINYLFSKKSD